MLLFKHGHVVSLWLPGKLLGSQGLCQNEGEYEAGDLEETWHRKLTAKQGIATNMVRDKMKNGRAVG